MSPSAVRALVRALTPRFHPRIVRVLWRCGAARNGILRHDVLDLTQQVFVALIANHGRLLRSWNPASGMSLEQFVELIAEREAIAMLQRRSQEDPEGESAHVPKRWRKSWRHLLVASRVGVAAIAVAAAFAFIWLASPRDQANARKEPLSCATCECHATMTYDLGDVSSFERYLPITVTVCAGPSHDCDTFEVTRLPGERLTCTLLDHDTPDPNCSTDDGFLRIKQVARIKEPAGYEITWRVRESASERHLHRGSGHLVEIRAREDVCPRYEAHIKVPW